MKRFAVLLLTLALAVCCTLPAFAADTIEVNEDVSVSGDYDWTRFKGQNMTLNVYNWGEYISNGSDDSLDVVSAFEDLTGIKVNYTTFDSNESMYAKLKSGAADYDVVIPSDYMVAKMIAEGMLKPLNYDNIPNFQKIDKEYLNPDYDPENAYTVPYMLCTTFFRERMPGSRRKKSLRLLLWKAMPFLWELRKAVWQRLWKNGAVM